MKMSILLVIACLLLSQIDAVQKSGRFDYGFALEFNVGVDYNTKYVDIPPLDKLGGAMTFEAWVYPAGVKGPIFEFGNGYTSNAIRLRWEGYYAYFEVNTNKIYSLKAYVPANDWSMVTAVIQSDGTVKLYVNGALQATSSSWPTPLLLTRSTNYIGRDSRNGYFSGVIDEVVVWSNALNPSDILIRKVLTGNETNVLHYWNFDQGIAGIADDLGSQHKDGALGGGVLTNYPNWVVPYAVNSAVCSATGDPHITTFDGTYWHFQGAGEYWLLKSDDDAIQIQVRQDQWVGNPGACVNIGFAFRAYGDTVSADVDFRRHPGIVYLYVNGVLTPVGNIYLPNSGVIITYTAKNDHAYWEIDAPFLWTMKIISYYVQYSNIWLRIYGDRYNTPMGGECGNWNGNPGDDFRIPISGKQYANPNDFWNYGMALKVPWTQSFFNNENQYTEVVPILDIEFKDPQLEATANSICKNRALVSAAYEWGCLFDIAVTGDIHLAYPSAEATYQDCIQQAARDSTSSLKCVPPCPNFCSLHGTCNNGVCTCNAGYTARDCSIQKKYWCNKATWNLNSDMPTETPFNPVESRSDIVSYYAYNRRYGSSAYTGYEIANATMILLQHYQPNVDSKVSQTSFVMINDRYEDGSGGALKASFALTDATGKALPLSIKVQDDPGDNYNWDSTNGNGNIQWNWQDCCTDGVALGFLPESSEWNLKINIDTASAKGIDQYFLGSRAANGMLDIFKIDSKAVSDGIVLSGGYCYDNCGANDNCTSCLDAVGCGWCEDVGVCSAGDALGPNTFRCSLWRWTKDPSISRVIGTTPGYPQDPAQLSVFLAQDDALDAHIAVNMPDYDDMPVDILILQDLSYSNFNPYLKFLESIYRTVYLNTIAIYPLARFGLASFSDKPVLPYGSPSAGDHVYQLRLGMTSNSQRLQAAITALTIADGQDAPQSQLEALLLISQRVGDAGYASTAKKLVAVVTKSTFHTPTGNPNFVPNNGNGVIDPKEDYPSVEQVRVALLTANVVPIFVVPSDIASTYRDLVNTWGFGYVSVMSSGIENLGQQILEGINFVCTSPYLTPNTKGFIQGSSPQIYSGIGPGIRVNFDVTLLDNGATNASIVAPGYGTTTIAATRDDLPQPNPVTSYTLYEDSSVVAVLDGTSIYSEALSAEIIALPTRGTLVQYASGTMGDPITEPGTVINDALKRVYYVPQKYHHGIPFDQITYVLSDSCEACSRKVNVTFNVIHVNHPPVAAAVTPVVTDEDTPVQLTLGGSDVDVEDTITSFVNAPRDGLGDLYQFSGTILNATTQITDSQFRVVYRPRLNQNGKTTFSYYLYDGQSTSQPLTINVVVNPVNDPPVPIDGNVTTFENGRIALQFTGTDVDIGDVLTASVQVLPSKGSLYQWGQDNLTLGDPISAVPATVRDALGRVWYVPNQYAHGLPLEDVAFTISDVGVPPPSISRNGTVKVWVIHVNNPPQAFTGTSSGDEDTPQALTLSGFDPDTSTEGDKLYAFLCTLPSNGKVFQFDGTPITAADVNANGTWAVTDSQGRIRYQPNQDGNCGPCVQAFDAFTFQMADRVVGNSERLLSSCANFTVYVQPVNDPPVASTITPFDGVEDTDGIVLLQCTDVDQEPISFQVAPLPTRGTLYQAQASGDTWVRDATNATVSFNGTVQAAYWDGNLLHTAYVVFRSPLNANGWPYDKFTYHCTDAASSSNNFLVNVNVQPVNDPPVVNGIANITIDEDSFADFVINGTDVESPVVFPEIVRCPDSSSTVGFLYQVNADNSLGSKIFVTNNQPTAVTSPNYVVRFKPAADQNDATIGSPYVTILFGVNDGNLSSIPKAVSIFVTPVNDAPVATAYSPMGGDEDTDITLPLTAYDIDNTQSELSVYVDVLPSKGDLYQVDSQGRRGALIANSPAKVTDPQFRVIYRAPQDQCSPDYSTPYDQLSYHVEDLEPLPSATKVVKIIVAPVDDAPVAHGVAQLIGFEDSYVLVPLNASDVDNTAGQLVLRASVGMGSLYQYNSAGTPPLGALIGSSGVVNGAIVVFKPDPLTYSTLSENTPTEYTKLKWSVSDPAGLSDSAVTSVVIVHVNHPPVAVTKGFSVMEDSPPVPVKLEGFDVDKIDTILQIDVVVLPTRGKLLHANSDVPIAIGEQFNGNCRFQPTEMTHGWDSLVYRVWDGYAYSALQTVDIFTVHVNHRPVAALNGYLTGTQGENVGPFELKGTDPDGDTPLLASVTALPTKGMLFQVNKDGSMGDPIKAVPTQLVFLNLAYYRQFNDSEWGPNYDTFQYVVDDLQGTAVSVSFPTYAVIDLNSANKPPTANATTPVQGLENQLIYIPLQGTSGDADKNQTITAYITTFPTRGTLFQSDNTTVGASGLLHDFKVLYQPPMYEHSQNDSNENPQPYARFGFTVVDSLNATSPEFFVDIIILSVNQLPTSVPPSKITTLEDTPVTFSLNSTDIENDPTHFIVTSVPDTSVGVFSYRGQQLNLSSSFPSPATLTFTPGADLNGDPFCVFRYTATDLEYRTDMEVQYTVAFAVTAVNDAPTVSKLAPPPPVKPFQTTFQEITWNTTYDSDGFHGALSVSLAVHDVDADQNYLTLTVRTSKGISITELYMPFPNGTGVIERFGNPITFTGTLDQLNAGLGKLQLERFDSSLGDEFLLISVNDLGHTGIGGEKVTNMTYYLRESFRDLTVSGNNAAITGAAVAGGVAAIGAAFGAYKLLKKNNLIDSADPWESEDAFQSTIDNPLYNHDQNANVLYEPPPSGTA